MRRRGCLKSWRRPLFIYIPDSPAPGKCIVPGKHPNCKIIRGAATAIGKAGTDETTSVAYLQQIVENFRFHLLIHPQ